MEERYQLTIERIRRIMEEETVQEPYRAFFRVVAAFLLKVDERKSKLDREVVETEQELKLEMEELYRDVLPEHYATSYANPAYAVQKFGTEMGRILCALYAELRGDIAYVWERRLSYLTIGNELFIEMYNQFEAEELPEAETLRKIFYWYASDYCDVFAADRIIEQVDPKKGDFLVRYVLESDLSDLSYLYRTGEYVSENEYRTAQYLNGLPQDTIDQMADTYTEGYRKGFACTGKDLSKKEVAHIIYVLGFERVVKKAIENFEAMGLQPVIYRSGSSVVTRPRISKSGFHGAVYNKQYDYDHKDDLSLILDKQFVERKLEVMRTTYEQNKKLSVKVAGPAVIEVFGEKPFSPEAKTEACVLSASQEELLRSMNARAGQMTNTYIPGEERSFTVIAWPIPEIGEKYPEIFDEVIRINTLDYDLYQNVQQKIIDALDQGTSVEVKGYGENRTDLTIQLYRLSDPEKETIFENCVADVNIPVGEVFTTPVLEGTNGVLHVREVYLDELLYQDLEIWFQDGKITDYRCANFEDEAQGKTYMKDNILRNHPTLPIGEFAIGTNTTAYAAAKKYQIADRLPVLIAEKMGPHFAVGDTCYSWEEDVKTYNPDGKEIVARDNSVSICRKEDPDKAYFQCHTDITIPYEEVGKISVRMKDGSEIAIIRDGRFVLPGTEILNEPLDSEE